jgi:hypothetical protein
MLRKLRLVYGDVKTLKARYEAGKKRIEQLLQVRINPCCTAHHTHSTHYAHHTHTLPGGTAAAAGGGG